MSHAQTKKPLEPASLGEKVEFGIDLLGWLRQHDGRVQLPIDIGFDGLWLGPSSLSIDGETVEINLDTSALSMGLRSHLRSQSISCPCRVWLEGKWGPLVDIAPNEEELTFSVWRVIGRADANDQSIRVPK